MCDLFQAMTKAKKIKYCDEKGFNDAGHPTLLFLNEMYRSEKKIDKLSYHRFLTSLQGFLDHGTRCKYATEMKGAPGIIEIKSPYGQDHHLRINCCIASDGTLVILNHYIKERVYDEKHKPKGRGRENEQLIDKQLQEAVHFQSVMKSIC